MKRKLLSLLMALVTALVLIPGPLNAAASEGAAITISEGAFRGKYVMIAGSGATGLYQIGQDGVLRDSGGNDALFRPDTYTLYLGADGFACGTVTVGQTDETVTAALTDTRLSGTTSYDIRRLYAASLFHNTPVFDHVDVRIDDAYLIQMGNQAFFATVTNPSVEIRVGGQVAASHSLPGTTGFEWRKTGLRLTKADTITVEVTMDLHYTDGNGDPQTIKGVKRRFDSTADPDKFIDAIAACDMVSGLDFRIDLDNFAQENPYYAVIYRWEVYHTDGTLTSLPTGAPGEPPATLGHSPNELYAYDGEYITGTSFYDYDKELLYTFHGWDTFSHSDIFCTDPGAGYYALDDGDTDPSNDPTISITADTYIYGYWTATKLAPEFAHIAIEKVFLLDGVEVPVTAAEDLWFRIDTGIDRDGDGETTIDVDYPMIAAASHGEYKIPVYQFDTPFVFTEYNAEIPGYSRTTTVTASGDYITGFTQSGDSVSVTMEPVHEGQNIHLGTVTYTNNYTKNVGAPVTEYPVLTLLKSTADTHQAQSGAVFALCRDEACQTSIATVTTDVGGIVVLELSGLTPGTYYLKETVPNAGYQPDPCRYILTLTEEAPVEEIRDNRFVTVTPYTLSITVPEGSTAACAGDRLHIFSDPIVDDGSYVVDLTPVVLLAIVAIILAAGLIFLRRRRNSAQN